MLTVTIPAHTHTSPEKDVLHVEKETVEVKSYPKCHSLLRTIPVFGLFYAVYLCISARSENASIRKQLPYAPSDHCENPTCAEILNARYGEAVLAFFGGFGLLWLITILHAITVITLLFFGFLKHKVCSCFQEEKLSEIEMQEIKTTLPMSSIL